MFRIIRSSEIIPRGTNYLGWVDAIKSQNPDCPPEITTYCKKALDRMEDYLLSDFEDYPGQNQKIAQTIESITIDYGRVGRKLPVHVVLKDGREVDTWVSVSNLYYAITQGRFDSDDYTKKATFADEGYDMAEEIVERIQRKS